MDVLWPLLLFSFIGGISIYISTRTLPADEGRWLSRWLAIALGLRLSLATMFAVFPKSRLFHEDADGYEWLGQLMARGWSGRGPELHPAKVLQQNYGWQYICGTLYYIFGEFAPLAPMFNCVIGVITIFVIYKLSRRFFHVVVAQRAALMATLIPSMILWHSVALKDPVVTLLILIGLYGCVSLKQRFSWAAVVAIAFAIVAVQPIRFYMSYFIAFAVVLSLVIERGAGFLPGIYKQIFVGGAVVMLLVVLGYAGRAESGLEMLSFERVSSFRHGMATTANSGFDASTDVSTPGRAIAFLPIGIAELLFSPFPWQLSSVRAAMALPETLYWWLVFPATIRGLWSSFRKRFNVTSPLILFAVTMTCAYSLVHGNVGSAFRQRSQIFVILFIFTAYGVWQRRCRVAGVDENKLLTDDDARKVA
jgi:hypothetical protein